MNLTRNQELEAYIETYQHYYDMWKSKEILDRVYFSKIIELSYHIFRLGETVLASGMLCDLTEEYLSDDFVIDCMADPDFCEKSDFVYTQLVKHGYIEGGPKSNMVPAMA